MLLKPSLKSVGLPIGGFVPFSMVDWQDQLCAVVFTQGCQWCCHYCHNPHLIPTHPASHSNYHWKTIVEVLKTRRNLLDGVVFSGGEPTLHLELPDAINQMRELGFRIGLHTGGPFPNRMERLLPLLDWVGFDFKAPWDEYFSITGKDHGRNAEESLDILLEYGTKLEIRTTWHGSLLSNQQLLSMAASLQERGIEHWVIQRFRSERCSSPELRRTPSRPLPYKAIQKRIPNLEIR